MIVPAGGLASFALNIILFVPTDKSPPKHGVVSQTTAHIPPPPASGELTQAHPTRLITSQFVRHITVTSVNSAIAWSSFALVSIPLSLVCSAQMEGQPLLLNASEN